MTDEMLSYNDFCKRENDYLFRLCLLKGRQLGQVYRPENLMHNKKDYLTLEEYMQAKRIINNDYKLMSSMY